MLIKASFIVLKTNKNLIFFPIFSFLGLFLVTASFTTIHFFSGTLYNDAGELMLPPPPTGNIQLMDNIIYYGSIYSFYFILYLVMIYFNSALVGCAKMHLIGENPSINDGFKMANSRIRSILGWGSILAVVGLIFKSIEGQSKTMGKVISGFLGVAWSLTTFLVIPIIVIEGKGPIESFKESAKLLKKSWGDQLLLNVGFGLIFLPIIIATPFVLYALFFSIDTTYHLIIFIVYMLFWGIALSLHSVLQTIFQTALYIYLKEGKLPYGFSSDLLDKTIIPE
jgi:Family of unknown function (DUF6159)